MNSPEDEIPLPSIGVLTEKESARQVREDACRYYIEQIKYLEAQLEGVSSSLLVANKNLDVANARLDWLLSRQFNHKTRESVDAELRTGDSTS